MIPEKKEFIDELGASIAKTMSSIDLIIDLAQRASRSASELRIVVFCFKELKNRQEIGIDWKKAREILNSQIRPLLDEINAL